MARSQELNGAATLVASFGALVLTGGAALNALVLFTRKNCQAIAGATEASLELAWPMTEVLGLLSQAMLPLLAAGIVASLAAQTGMAGLVWVPEAIKPKWQRLNPMEKLKSWFSPRMLVELAKILMKFAVLIWIGWRYWDDHLLPMVQTALLTTASLPGVASSLAGVAWKMALFLTVLGVLDAAYQKYDYRKQLRMTRYEVKQEHKQEEGDPHLKARRKAEARKLARAMSMAGVKKADVIVTNPIHLAVALQYERGMNAPKVVAKGAGHLARRIKELGRDLGVPIVENKPLARALYPLDLDEEIPETLYRAVAEVLVSVSKVEDYL